MRKINKLGKFFKLGPAFRGGSHGLDLENEEAILTPGRGEMECFIEATGHPIAGTRHALLAIEHNKHVVMVNVEADVMVGPILAEKAREKGLIYSMAYGDQPA